RRRALRRGARPHRRDRPARVERQPGRHGLGQPGARARRAPAPGVTAGRVAVVVTLAGACLVTAPPALPAQAPRTPKPAAYSGRATARGEAILKAVSGKLQHRPPGLRIDRIGPRSGVSTSTLRERLRKRPEVRYAEPDYVVAGSATTPNDPMFAQQYGLNQAD